MLPPIHVPELGLVDHHIGTNERDGKTGAVGRRKLIQRLPRAVTLCARGTPGDRIDGLPLEAQNAPDVVAAKARGDIEVLFADPPEEKPAPAPAPQKPAAPNPPASNMPAVEE